MDPVFREQLMAVLQAGKALVSRSVRAPGLCVHLPEARLVTGVWPLRAELTTTTMRKSWGMRP